ncbi:putative ribosomal RNA processing protein 36 -like [Scophthalmus maximus]|uniref:rRNA biogenesis protein RRP36 n=1 Tax=Scophthalmus maximus TaxID=52904 RepID=A0A2U9BLR9_SCOMX|nr:putative ribosomal RNA processing protein 36 -like [Scophthalmus maximus]
MSLSELSIMSFEDVMKLQNKVGTKVYNEVAYGNNEKRQSSKKKRLNKNRPTEISAKRPAPFLRQVVPVRKPTLRDPRFDDLSGEYKPEIFEKTYRFVQDIKQREKEIVVKQLKRKKTSNQRKEKLQFLLKRMVSQLQHTLLLFHTPGPHTWSHTWSTHLVPHLVHTPGPMSFEDVMKLQNKVGTKVYNEVAYGNNEKRQSSKKKRLNKNRPTEISAKRPAPFLRQVVPVRKPTLRDPRFDDLSGEYKPEIFEKTYRFVQDIKQREKEIVVKQLKRKKTSNQRKEKLQFLLKRMENQERARKSEEQRRERELQLKRQQRERANQGARPFFLKKSEQKKLQLAEKYQDLKKSGKLENFLSKKRKRNAGKDRRKLPQQLHSSEAS